MNQDLMNRINAMMQQRGASGNGIMGYASGGGVPRQTEIGGQPHMLAYINPEEEQMLYAAGGSGEPGPGGVPAFRTLGMSPGEAGARGGGYQGGDTGGSPTGGGYSSNNSPAELAYVAARQAEAQRAANAAVARQEAEMQAVLQDAADKAAIAQQEADLQAAQSNAYMDVPNNAYMDVSNNFDSDVGDTFGTGNIYTETTPGASTTNSGNANNNSNIIQQEQDAANAAAATAAEAEAQRVAIEAQAQQAEQTRLADEQAESQRIQALVNDSIATTNQAPAIPVIGQDIDLDPYAPKFAGFPSAPSEFAGFPSAPVVDPVLDPVVNPAEAFRANEQRLANASGANIVNPFDDQDEIVEQALSAAELATSEFLGNNAVQAGINLGASDGSGTSPSVITSLAMGDGTESPTELQNIKNRVSVVEGTSDADGYNRLLDKGEKGTFVNSKPLSEMTVAEAVAFGQGEEYRNYSRRVLGRSPDELPSTPMGKYQIVGNTLADLVNRGIVDPDAKFDAATQEKLGDYLINNRGYDKLQSGEITLAEFEDNLGKEFQGIDVQGLGDVTVESFKTPADEIDQLLASVIDTGTQETSGEILARLAAERATSGDTSSGDGVQVAAMDSRGPLSDLIMSQALGLNDIDNLVNASSTVPDSGSQTDVSIDPSTGNMINNETGEVMMQASSLADFRGDGMGGETSTDAQALAALEYYATGAGADGATQPMYDINDLKAKVNSGGTLSDQEFSYLKGKTSSLTNQIEPEYDLNDDDGIPTDAEINGTTTDLSNTDLYLSAIDKISAEGYDPDANGNLTEPEQRALYGARGQTPNAAETAYLEFLLSDAKHKEDSTIKGDDGKPIYKAGEYVTKQSGGQKFEDFAVSFIDTFLNPVSFLGDNFTLGGINASYVEEQLNAYKNGGTFVYGDDGKTVVGVASPNFDASGDGNNDTVVLFDGDGNKTVTGDGIAISDITTSNSNTDGEDFDIDIVNSNKTYTNTEDGVVVGTRGVEEEKTGDDNNFIICEEGFEFDPVEGICMPIVGVGDGTGGSNNSNISIGDVNRNVSSGSYTSVPSNVTGLKINTPKQFNRGGMVTPNISRFVQSLGM